MYHLLPELNNIKEIFIPCMYIVIKAFQISNRNISYNENILNIEQDIQPVINKLLLIPSKMLIFVYGKSNPNACNGYKDFNISRNKILS